MARFKEKIVYLFSIVLLSFCVFILSLKETRLTSIDSAIRASIARNIIETGSWYPPIFEEKILVDHPPLHTWSIAASFKLLGVSDFSSELPVRLYSIGSIVLVFLIANLFNLPAFFTFLAAFIFLTTRDFILITIRGGIEPTFIFYSLLSWLLLIYSTKGDSKLKKSFSILSGISIVLSAFSKGPPALWPFVFSLLFILTHDFKSKNRNTFYYLLGIVFGISIWIKWVQNSHTEDYWLKYWNEQVLGSALKGRGDPTNRIFYYFDILIKFYWPWFPLFILSIYFCLKNLFQLKKLNLFISELQKYNPESLLFWSTLCSAGYFLGFTLVKWKLSYYIVPLFSSSGLAISSTLFLLKEKYGPSFFFSQKTPMYISIFSFIFIFIYSIGHFHFQSDRFIEFIKFKPYVIHNNHPIVFYKNSKMHNDFATLSYWHFHKILEKREPRKDDFIILDKLSLDECMKDWCIDKSIVTTTESSILMY